MKRDGHSFEIETRQEAEYAAIAVAQVNDDRTLHAHPEIIDMFAAADDKAGEFEAIKLSEASSSLVFKAIRAKAEKPGNSVEDAIRRLQAVGYLSQLDLLGVKSLAAAE